LADLEAGYLKETARIEESLVQYREGLLSGLKHAASARGAAGGTARAKKYAELRAYAMNLYAAKAPWPSRLQAAKALAPTVFAKSKSVGRPLSEENAQKTIYRWLSQVEVSTNRKT
jgi:hypothetical protein